MPHLPDRTVLYAHVTNFRAVYADTSYLNAANLGKPLDGTGLPLKPEDATDEVLRQTARHLDAIKGVETKTPPSTYEYNVTIQADYPDGRAASRDNQFLHPEPSDIANAVKEWCDKVVVDLVRIGDDDI